MTINEVLDLVNYIARKEESGNTLSPEQFNRVLEAVNADLFKKEYEEAQKVALSKKIPLGDVIFSSASLRIFRKREEDVSVTNGVLTLSSLSNTYVYWISMITEYNGALRAVEFVSDSELEDRQTNLLGKPIKYFPAAIDNGTEIRVHPTDISSVDFTYLKMPNVPEYSWIMDAYDNARYLEPSYVTGDITIDSVPSNAETHTISVNYNAQGAVEIGNYTAATGDGLTKQQLAQGLAEGVNDSYSSTGYFASVGTEQLTIYYNTSVGSGSDYAVTAGGTGSANFTVPGTLSDGTGSTELEWASAYHPQVAQEILARIGVSLNDQQVQAYAERAKEADRMI